MDRVSWNQKGKHAANEARVGENIRIFDTTLRDGEQTAGVCFSVQDKLDIAERLQALGVDVIEAGFPASSAGEQAAVTAVARQIRRVSICALARAVPRDVEHAALAIAPAERPRIHVFVNASDIQLAQQLRKTAADVLDMTRAAVALARNHTVDVEFSPMDATRARPEFLAEIVRTALAAGARTINVPDTVGFALPEQVGRIFARLSADVPELEQAVLSFHGQNDLGLATANALAAVGAGARQLEVTVNGIGERAGNTSLEEVVVALRLHGRSLGVHSDVDPRGICALSRLVEERSRVPVQPNKAIVGANAFRHASGIHQDGVLKHPSCFEVIDPALIGHPQGSEIVLGKLSGRAGFAHKVASLGIDLADGALDRAFTRFQSLAERRPRIEDEEIKRICSAYRG